MAYVVCRVPAAPLRVEASSKSEMGSQLLLAEAGLVLEETKEFVKLQCVYDGYEGWCLRNQLVFTETWENSEKAQLFTTDWLNTVTINEVMAHVPMGTPLIHEANAKTIARALRIDYRLIRSWNAANASPEPDSIRARATQYLNTPYLWGGRSVFGIDCSGLTQMVYRFFNIPLQRDAYLQATQGESIGFLQEARCGDLAYFDNAEGRITHVGILLNDHEIIHASGFVRIDKIDNAGIINAESGMRTHQLRIIKRYFE